MGGKEEIENRGTERMERKNGRSLVESEEKEGKKRKIKI